MEKGHFLPYGSGSSHQAARGLWAKVEEGFYGIAIFSMGEEDLRLLFGEDVLVRKGADVFSEASSVGKRVVKSIISIALCMRVPKEVPLYRGASLLRKAGGVL